MRRTSCLTFNLSWPVWVKASLGEETVDAVIESMGAFEQHSVAYLSDKDVARLANRFILDVLLKGLGR